MVAVYSLTRMDVAEARQPRVAEVDDSPRLLVEKVPVITGSRPQLA